MLKLKNGNIKEAGTERKEQGNYYLQFKKIFVSYCCF